MHQGEKLAKIFCNDITTRGLNEPNTWVLTLLQDSNSSKRIFMQI